MIVSRITKSRLLFAGLITAALYMLPVSAAKLYKWVDEDGTVHYSDKLPPEASQGAHEQLNKHGQTTGVVKEPGEELEAEIVDTVAEEQRRRQAEIEARERMRDRILLDTFTTERDLMLTRDDRLNAIDSQINLMKGNNDRIQRQVSEVQARIDRIRSKGTEVPANLLKQQDSLNDQLGKNQEYISARQKERNKLAEQFEADLKRFRELKGIESPVEIANPNLTDDNVATAPIPAPPATR
ncbi:MAG TPA: DUF4124 domain-containing protein [Gammaproteobacteria bacterium]